MNRASFAVSDMLLHHLRAGARVADFRGKFATTRARPRLKRILTFLSFQAQNHGSFTYLRPRAKDNEPAKHAAECRATMTSSSRSQPLLLLPPPPTTPPSSSLPSTHFYLSVAYRGQHARCPAGGTVHRTAAEIVSHPQGSSCHTQVRIYHQVRELG